MKRHEFKLSFPSKDYHWVIRTLLSNSLMFKEIYQERKINNLYFDTLDFEDYNANVNGHRNRSKFRIRWYGNDTPIHAILENKLKEGEVGDKISYSMNGPLDFNQLTSIHDHFEFEDVSTKLLFSQRNPVLLNSYDRRYFISHDHKLRITLDRNLSYAHPVFNEMRLNHQDLNILEIKCAVEDKLVIDQLIQSLNLRLDKYSKYVSGLKCVYGF